VSEALAPFGYSEPVAAKLRPEGARMLDARKTNPLPLDRAAGSVIPGELRGQD
jgi:hypothetical protein